MRRCIGALQVALAVALIALACLALAATAAAGGIQIATEPQVIRKTILPGERTSFDMEVRNTGSVAVEVVPEVVDLAVDEAGYNVEVSPGSGYRWGVREIASISPKKLTLRPGEAKKVKVSLAAPKSLSGGRYGILFFAASDPTATGQIRMVVRCGSLLFLTVPRTETYSGQIREVRVVPASDTGGVLGTFEAVFANEGNVHFTAIGRLGLFKAGKVVADLLLEGGTGTILPGGARRYRAVLPADIPDGEYRATVAFTFEGRTARLEKTLVVADRKAILR
ncbi:MAG: hypothetical protein GX492_09915 [Firmicutes bacterium]|nr:hypothetical protein [Bacillota bacterium]